MKNTQLYYLCPQVLSYTMSPERQRRRVVGWEGRKVSVYVDRERL